MHRSTQCTSLRQCHTVSAQLPYISVAEIIVSPSPMCHSPYWLVHSLWSHKPYWMWQSHEGTVQLQRSSCWSRAGHCQLYKVYVWCCMTGPVTIPVIPEMKQDCIWHTDGRWPSITVWRTTVYGDTHLISLYTKTRLILHLTNLSNISTYQIPYWQHIRTIWSSFRIDYTLANE